MWPRIFQGSLGCGKGSLPLLCWGHVKGPSRNTKVVKIPSQTPKILERSLATPQIFRSLGFFEGSLTCGQGSFKDLWGVARDLCHFCSGLTSRVPHRGQKGLKIPSQSPKILERSLATPQIFRSLGFFEGSLTCGQGSFKDLWGVARDLCHFCSGLTSRVPPGTQKW